MMLCKLVFPSNEIFKLASFPNTFSELLDAIRFRVGETSGLNFSLKYKDFENELVSLNNEEDFQTAILSCQSEKLQTLKVFILSPPANSRKASPMITKTNHECVCEECGDEIKGVKFICLQCENYKCCEDCEDEAEHAHPLLKFKSPTQGKPTAQSAHGSIQYKFNMQLSPEKSSSVLRRSLTKSMKEKKVPYTGEISFNSIGEQPVKVFPIQNYICQINIKNTGRETWPADVRLNCVNGIYRNREEAVLALEPGAKQIISLNLETPAKTGRYLSQWKLYFNDEGKQRSFGDSLFLEMHVEERKSSSGESTPKKNACSMTPTGQVRRMRSSNQIQLCLEVPKEAVECGVSETKGKIAGYLNEIFPGELKEKIAFVEKFTDLEVQDMSKMVELYLINLSKKKFRGGCKPHGSHHNSHEVSVTL